MMFYILGKNTRKLIFIGRRPVGTYIAHIETKAGITDVKFVKVG